MGITQQIGASSIIKPGVIDNTAARPASPYEGQVIFQKDTDQLLVWNGTAWVIPNSPAQNPQGLELVKTQTITSGATVVVTNVFSSTYDNYRIFVDNGVATGNAAISLQLGPSSVSGYNTSYYSVTIYAAYSGGAVANANVNNGSSWVYSGYARTSNGISFMVDVCGPNLAKYASISNGYAGADGAFSAGYHSSTNQFTDFTLAGATFTSGTIRVYGYRNS